MLELPHRPAPAPEGRSRRAACQRPARPAPAPAGSFAGRIRAPNSTDTLQIRAVAVPLPATGRTAHLVFFAPGPTPEPSTFEQLLSTFRSVQDSVSFPS